MVAFSRRELRPVQKDVFTPSRLDYRPMTCPRSLDSNAGSIVERARHTLLA
jgi:hypothetical protein